MCLNNWCPGCYGWLFMCFSLVLGSKYPATDHGITSSSFCHISFYEKYNLVFVRSKKLCLTVMGDESIQSRLLQQMCTFCYFYHSWMYLSDSVFWVFQHLLHYIVFVSALNLLFHHSWQCWKHVYDSDFGIISSCDIVLFFHFFSTLNYLTSKISWNL